MIDAQYNTFTQVLAHYHSVGKVCLSKKEVQKVIPALNALVEAQKDKNPVELTAMLKHDGLKYYVEANIEYYPANEYMAWVKQIWR